MNGQDGNEVFARLRELLVGPEQAQIGQLRERVEDPQVRSEDVAETLPESIRHALRTAPEELAEALEQPVTASIHKAISRDSKQFAEALFPVMGPAIRRYIVNAIKELMQGVNQTLEQSLSLRGMKWRFEAWRSGVPFPEIVVRNTLLYRVEQAFLIQPGSGLLMAQVSAGEVTGGDADAISGMLTAIRDFVSDAFIRDGEYHGLDSIEVGEHTVWLVHGADAYLACAIRGIPPLSLRTELEQLLDTLQQRYARQFRAFAGDPLELDMLAEDMRRCLRSQEHIRSARRGIGAWLLAVALVAVAGVWAMDTWHARQARLDLEMRWQAFVTRIGATPGLVVTAIDNEDGVLRVDLLRDPLAAEPATLAAPAGLAGHEYVVRVRPFQSGDPEVAYQRLRQRLAPPDGVVLTLDAAGVAAARGIAPVDWMTRASMLALTVPGVDAYDDTGLRDLDAVLRERLIATLGPPQTVAVTVVQGRARIQGEAPLAWVSATTAHDAASLGLQALDVDHLVVAEIGELARLRADIESTTVQFSDGAELDSEGLAQLHTLAQRLIEAQRLARLLDRELAVEVIGRTDGLGGLEYNHYIAQMRATVVNRGLVDAGVDAGILKLRAIPGSLIQGVEDRQMRRVDLRLLVRQRKPVTEEMAH